MNESSSTAIAAAVAWPSSLSTPLRSLSHTHHRSLSLFVFCLCRHFKPDPRQIKKRIEDLIAREYLERDASNSTVYKYLA